MFPSETGGYWVSVWRRETSGDLTQRGLGEDLNQWGIGFQSEDVKPARLGRRETSFPEPTNSRLEEDNFMS